jgi:uncharacterized membrane protein YphA (DoxX/SURF4 family)
LDAIGISLSLLVGAVFVTAGMSKLLDPERFRTALAAFDGRLAAAAAAIVPPGELVLGVWLASGLAQRAGALIAVAVLLAFSWALVRLGRSGAADCGCFGAQGSGDYAAGLARNGLLALACLALAVAPGPVWSADPAEVAGSACVAVGLTCLWQCLLAARNLTTGRPLP